MPHALQTTAAEEAGTALWDLWLILSCAQSGVLSLLHYFLDGVLSLSLFFHSLEELVVKA